jgi:Ca2+-binding RTX toxin-like protein
MDGRFRREDLERLLELVDTKPASSLHGDSSEAVFSPLWAANRKFWVDRLRTETDGTWDDDQYTDAANILNLAEHQQSVFQSFNAALRQSFPGPELASLVNRTGSHPGYGEAAISADQIIAWPAVDPTSSVSSVSAAAIGDQRPPGLSDNDAEAGPLGPFASGRVSDLALVTGAKNREHDGAVFGQIRSNLFLQTGLAFLQPYQGWDDFQSRNALPGDLIQDLKTAYPDGFETVDLWVGGLAEAAEGASLGPTLAAAAHEQLQQLPLDALELLAGTAILTEIYSTDFSKIAMRHSAERSGANSSSQTPDDAGGRGLLIGTDGADLLYGSAGDDIILGLGGDDVLFGGRGDDIVDGGTGADRMAGNQGDDIYRVDDDTDQVIEHKNQGIDTVETGLSSYRAAAHVENVTYTGADVFRGSGNQLDNTITGGAAADQLSGDAGDDVLLGSGGDDVLDGGTGNDVLIAGAGDDTAEGGDGDDTVSGGTGDDVISGGAGNDQIRGNSGADVLVGGTGDDHISGGDGSDILLGGAGDDVLAGGDGADVILGGEGDDVITAGDGDDDTPELDNPADDADTDDSAGDSRGATSPDTIVMNEPAQVLIQTPGSGTGNPVETSFNVQVVSENFDIFVLMGDSGAGNTDGQPPTFTFTLASIEQTGPQDGPDDRTTCGSVVADAQGDLVLNGDPSDSDSVESLIEGPTVSADFNLIILIGDGNNGLSSGDLITAIADHIDGDILDGGAGNDRITGGSGDDLILGGDGNDTLCGGEGNDVIDGGSGNDWVISDQGNDYLLFTRGNDTISLRPGFGNDVVIGFDSSSQGSGGQDRIDVSAYGFTSDAFGSGIILLYDGEATVVQIGNDSLRLMLVNLETMDTNDFIFA